MRLRFFFALALFASGCDCSGDTHSAATPDGGYIPPFDAGPDSGPPPGNGVGEPCEETRECRRGLECDSKSGTCQPVPDGAVDEPCELTGQCEDDPPLYCDETGTCQPAGTGADGDPCSTTGDCQRGLYCDIHGLVGTCRPAGTGDWGDDCESTGDCLAGLYCGAGGTCEPFAFAFLPWPGVDCPPDEDGSVAYFEVPRGGVAPNDFFRLPFANDIRVNAGVVDLSGFPTPGVGPFGIDIVQTYVDAIERDMTSFGTNQAVHFRFSTPIDGASVLADSDPPGVVIQDVSTPDAPLRGLRWSANWHSKYICDNWIAVGPSSGFPNLPQATYAVWLTTAARDVDGNAYERDEDFEAMMSDAVPADPDLAAAHQKYAVLRAYLDAHAIPRDSILVASVYTVGNVRSVASNLRDAIRNSVPAPVVSGTMLCDDVQSSLCVDGGDATARECGAVDARYHEIHAQFSNPIMQEGVPPFESESGAIPTDALGVPQAQGSDDVCMALTVPAGVAMPAAGWPVVLYAHGTGGDFRSGIREGVAGALANVSLVGGGTANFATIGYDGVVHGPRREGSPLGEDELFFNAANPPAARDNVLQGAADLFQLVRLVESFTLDTGSSPTGEAIRFDPSRIYFLGHSQGGTVGSLFVPYEPNVRVAVFSGTGGLLLESLEDKTSPSNIPAGLSVLLQEPIDRITWWNPPMHLFQWYFDRSDPVNYGRLLAREPAPGMPTNHFLQTWGEGDTYSPEDTITAFAFTAYAVPVNPLIPDRDGDGDLDGDFGAREGPIDAPVTSNFLCPGTPECTAVITEYVPDGYDGHFVAQRDDRAIRQWTNFFGSAAVSGSGVPTLQP